MVSVPQRAREPRALRGVSMGLTYFKRYRMELDLSHPLFKAPALAAGYFLEPWDDSLVESHAEAKFQSFCLELDANLFPCLGDRDGCRRLMQEIASREGFIQEATWLLTYQSGSKRIRECCGTVQGVRDSNGYGAIQNLGITPSHRGQGLGSILMHAALSGFQRAGLRRAFLEVTAQNCGAVVLYQRLGFFQTKTVYKAADVAYA
jgi:ribosomal protein S18 acetylase RimI-like enzyme